MLQHELPDCKALLSNSGELRAQVAKAVSQAENAARLRGGEAPAGHFDDLVALFDQASAAVTALQAA